jgi:cell division protease FtsH
MGHGRDYSEEIASSIDEEIRRLIESAHDEAWEVLVEYRDVLDALVLRLLDKETVARTEVLEIFASVVKRPVRGSYTGYGKRLPSDRPPVLSPKELALAAADGGAGVSGLALPANGQAVGFDPRVAGSPAGHGDGYGEDRHGYGDSGPGDGEDQHDHRGPSGDG